jgi:hypothetical protein
VQLNVQFILTQIDQVLHEWKAVQSKSQYDDCSDQPGFVTAELISRLSNTIFRLSPSGTLHRTNLDRLMHRYGDSPVVIQSLVGALNALRRDYETGHLSSFEELVHANTFSGFIEMAEYLHGAGYKDAAAVITGSVLEQHLRELCSRNGISTDAGGKTKKAETLNTDLAGQAVYSKLDQKNVTSWLGLRNDAAHGNYANYTAEQVRLMMSGINDFLGRHPA